MTSSESRARSALDNYLHDVGTPQTITQQDLLRKLIAEAIKKAVNEDRDALRENMACDTQDPCTLGNVCSRHKALAGAMLGVGVAH